MNVAVCVKQIPDPANPGRLDPNTHTLVREGKLILDESDSYGVEMALQLVDKAGGGEVTLVSMVPNNETSGLRTALAMGAHKAILVSDDSLKGSDALGTAKILAAAIRRAEPDLIIAATESTDGYTGTLPVQLAELLGLPSITFAKHVEIVDGKVKVNRQTEAGYDEVECVLPALVTVTAGVVEPRYPSFKGIMAAKNKPLDRLAVADLGVPVEQVGAGGAGQEVVSVEPADERRRYRGRRRQCPREDCGLPRAAQGHLEVHEEGDDPSHGSGQHLGRSRVVRRQGATCISRVVDSRPPPRRHRGGLHVGRRYR